MKICNVLARINWIKHPKGLCPSGCINTLTKIFPARKTQKIFSKVLNNIKNVVEINLFLTLFFLMVGFLLMSFLAMAEDDFSASLSDLNQTIPADKQNDLPWGRDPFIPPPFGITDAGKELELTAILYSSKEPTAVINKKIVKVHDTIGDQKIVDIKKDYVILQNDGGSFRLELADLIKNPNDIKAMR